MNFLGKTLVIVNLIFSLVVGGLIIMVFIARTNWAEAYNKASKEVQIANSNAKAYFDEAEKARADGKNEVAKVQTQLAEVQKQLAAEQVARKNADFDLANSKGTVGKGSANATLAELEVRRREDEVKRLEEQLLAINKQNAELVVQMNTERDKAVAATIERDSVKVRNVAMSQKLEEMATQMAKAKATGGDTKGVAGAKNPPTEQVEGLIKDTDTSGLVTITIGSDSGIKAGNTLEVFRLNPTAKYLGTLYILEVRAHEAVGRPMGRPNAALQKGDHVASKILGS